MQKILRIAKLELSVLFYSPIAWIILIIIFVQAGLAYTDMLYMQETQQQLERQLNVLTRVMFAGEKGMLSALVEYLYLYIPLLTMGIFSREYSSGSFKLLQSSPVTAAEIVIGKYLSLVIYLAIIIVLLGLYAVAAYFSIDQMDIAFVLFGLAGLFLLMCAYSAIGLFMSSLTTYQIVAAISTLAFLAFLNYAKVLGAGYDGIRELTHWLSIGGRAEEIVNGLFTSRELIYFITVIIFFLGLAILRIIHLRAASSFATRSTHYAILTLVTLGILTVSSLPNMILYHDTTQISDRTLSPTGQEIASRLTDPIKMVSYVNVLDHKAAYGAPKNRMADISRFEGYRRFIPHLKMEYIVYYDSIPYLRLDSTETMLTKAKKSSEALGFDFQKILHPHDMEAYPVLKEENNSFVRFIEYQGKKIPLRMFDDIIQYPGESEFSAALLQLLDGPSVVGLLTGHGERDIVEFKDADYSIYFVGKSVRGSLLNQGFRTNKISTNELADFEGATVVIADPQQPYNAEELLAIRAYIERGGNLFLLGDPASAPGLQPIAEMLGVKFMPGTLLQESDNFSPDLLRQHLTPEAATKGMTFYDGANIVMNNAVGIQLVAADNRFEKTVLVATDSTSTWNKTTPFDLALEKVHFDPMQDTYIQVPTLIQMERQIGGRTQKIVVSGDADFISNSELNRFNINSVNVSLATRLFRWFSDGKYPVSARKERAPDVLIKASRQHINLQKGIFLLGFPLVIAVSGVITLRRRKRM